MRPVSSMAGGSAPKAVEASRASATGAAVVSRRFIRGDSWWATGAAGRAHPTRPGRRPHVESISDGRSAAWLQSCARGRKVAGPTGEGRGEHERQRLGRGNRGDPPPPGAGGGDGRRGARGAPEVARQAHGARAHRGIARSRARSASGAASPAKGATTPRGGSRASAPRAASSGAAPSTAGRSW